MRDVCAIIADEMIVDQLEATRQQCPDYFLSVEEPMRDCSSRFAGMRPIEEPYILKRHKRAALRDKQPRQDDPTLANIRKSGQHRGPVRNILQRAAMANTTS